MRWTRFGNAARRAFGLAAFTRCRSTAAGRSITTTAAFVWRTVAAASLFPSGLVAIVGESGRHVERRPPSGAPLSSPTAATRHGALKCRLAVIPIAVVNAEWRLPPSDGRSGIEGK